MYTYQILCMRMIGKCNVILTLLDIRFTVQIYNSKI